MLFFFLLLFGKTIECGEITEYTPPINSISRYEVNITRNESTCVVINKGENKLAFVINKQNYASFRVYQNSTSNISEI